MAQEERRQPRRTWDNGTAPRRPHVKLITQVHLRGQKVNQMKPYLKSRSLEANRPSNRTVLRNSWAELRMRSAVIVSCDSPLNLYTRFAEPAQSVVLGRTRGTWIRSTATQWAIGWITCNRQKALSLKFTSHPHVRLCRDCVHLSGWSPGSKTTKPRPAAVRLHRARWGEFDEGRT